MANKNRPSFYKGPDSESLRLASNDDPGTEDQRKAWKRAIAQEQADVLRAKYENPDATLKDLGIENIHEKGRARYNFFGGDEGLNQAANEYGQHRAQNNVKYGHWIKNPMGGYLDLDAAGNVRGTYDQYGRRTGGSAPMPFGGGFGSFNGPQQQYSPVDYSGYGGLMQNYFGTMNTGINGIPQGNGPASVTTPPPPPGYYRGAGSSWGGSSGAGRPRKNVRGGIAPSQPGSPTYNNPTLGLPPRTGGIKPARTMGSTGPVGQSVPTAYQNSWGG